MEQSTKSIFYRMIADKISSESACTYDDALEILEFAKPCHRKIAIIKATIIDMRNKGIDINDIKNACFGITFSKEIRILSDTIRQFGLSVDESKRVEDVMKLKGWKRFFPRIFGA